MYVEVKMSSRKMTSHNLAQDQNHVSLNGNKANSGPPSLFSAEEGASGKEGEKKILQH